MKSMLYELLSYEPMEEITGEEKDIVLAVLAGSEVSEEDRYYQLIRGFCNNYMSDSLNWLSDWRYNYYNGQGYPVILKKICYYYILVHNKTSMELGIALGINRKNFINKWNLYADYRRESEKINDINLPLNRSGKKAKYLLNLIQKVYYESYRQTVVDNHIANLEYDLLQDEHARTLNIKVQDREIGALKKDLPVFVDVYAGTGLVAASMNVESSKKIINELDPVVSAFIFVIKRYSNYFIREFSDFLTKVNQGYFNQKVAKLPKGFCQCKDRTFDYYTSNFVNELEEEWKNGNSIERLTLLKNIRNAWFYSQYMMLDDRAKSIRDVCVFNYYTVELTPERLQEICKVLCYYVFYYSTLLGVEIKPSFRELNEKEYYKILKTWCIEIPEVKGEDLISYLSSIDKVQVGYNALTDYAVAISNAIIGRLSFDEIFPRDVKEYWISPNGKKFEDNIFYYYDSPYWLTSQYEVWFTDEQHKIMIDSIRGSEFKWLFSMQYNEATKSKGTKDESKRDKKSSRIKDYYTYYSGFLAEFAEEDGVYTSTYSPSGEYKDVYVIFIDRSIRPKGVGKTATTKEMFVTNVDCRRVTPLNGLYVQLSMKKFLEYISENPEAEYDDIVEFAKIEYMKELIP